MIWLILRRVSVNTRVPLGSFQLYDLDKDGFISRHEMTIVVDAIYKMNANMVTLPEDEETVQKRVDKIFALMDKVGVCIPHTNV